MSSRMAEPPPAVGGWIGDGPVEVALDKHTTQEQHLRHWLTGAVLVGAGMRAGPETSAGARRSMRAHSSAWAASNAASVSTAAGSGTGQHPGNQPQVDPAPITLAAPAQTAALPRLESGPVPRRARLPPAGAFPMFVGFGPFSRERRRGSSGRAAIGGAIR